MVYHLASQAMLNGLSLMCEQKKKHGCSRRHTNEIISLPNSLCKNINADVMSNKYEATIGLCGG